VNAFAPVEKDVEIRKAVLEEKADLLQETNSQKQSKMGNLLY